MSAEFQNIIIRMPNWLGDAVMATPIIADVRARFPEANITAMCQGRSVAALLLGNPHLNEIFTFTRPNSFIHRLQNRDLIERLRQGQYDLGILIPNSLSSAWWFWRGGVRKRVGFEASLRRFTLTDPIPFPLERGKEHQVLTYKRLLAPLGIPLSTTPPALYLTEAERSVAKQLLKQYHIPEDATLVGINPGAAYGSAKCWPPECFREIIAKLAALPNTYILCFSDLTGAPLVHSICAGMPPQVVNLAASTNIRELMALTEQCTVFLTNDSGPMHIAAALQTPLVALFGSTSSIATGPYSTGTVLSKNVSCSPCFRRTCPIDFRCMKQLTVEEVYIALLTEVKNKS